MDHPTEYECLVEVAHEVSLMHRLTQALHEAVVERSSPASMPPSSVCPESVGGQIIPLVRTPTLPPQLIRAQSKG